MARRRRGPVFVPRYSGSIKIGLRYRDREDDYECRFWKVDRRGRQTEALGELYVNPPKVSRYSVDSPQAYDRTAQAALSFATNDGLVDESDLDYGDSDYVVRRMPPKA